MRLPQRLYQRLRMEAARNHRSLNSEIVYRLEASLVQDPEPSGHFEPLLEPRSVFGPEPIGG